MTVSININGLSLCHRGSDGIATATAPDVCKTPAPGGPVPIPYPNIAFSRELRNGTWTVRVDGGNRAAIKGSEFAVSIGDEPGTVGGVKSGTFKKEATWLSYSMDVKMEGRNACRLTDKMLMNHGNTVCMGGEMQAPLTTGPNPCCNDQPTPMDASALCDKAGDDPTGCDHYQKRYDDFVKRHSCCDPSVAPPAYYLEYGLKYCLKFTQVTYLNLSDAGKQWLKRARCNLQQYMEDGLQRRPELERDSDMFTKFAFKTHPSAYLDAGIADLPSSDLFTIGTTPELREWMRLDTWEQAAEVGYGIAGDWAEDFGRAVEETAEEVGRAVGEAANEVGRAVGETANEVSRAAEEAADAVTDYIDSFLD